MEGVLVIKDEKGELQKIVWNDQDNRQNVMYDCSKTGLDGIQMLLENGLSVATMTSKGKKVETVANEEVLEAID